MRRIGPLNARAADKHTMREINEKLILNIVGSEEIRAYQVYLNTGGVTTLANAEAKGLTLMLTQ
jgi:hypothetical protein